MPHTEEIRNNICKVPLCKRLPENMRERFATVLVQISKPRELTRGVRLYHEGEPDGGEGCLLLQGMVEITQSDGKKVFVEAPDIIGEGSQFKKTHERTASVDVVVGGVELTFAWRDLGRHCVQTFNKDERKILKRAIAETAWARSGKYLDYEPNEVA